MGRRRLTFTDDDVRRVWGNPIYATQQEAAAALDCSQPTLYLAARRLGLPPLTTGVKPSYDADLLAAAWMAGCPVKVIAENMGLRPDRVSYAVHESLKLPKRPREYRPMVTWDEFRAGLTLADVQMRLAAERAARGAAVAAVPTPTTTAPRPDYPDEVPVEAARQLWQAVLLAMWRCALDLVICKDGEFEVAEARRWFGSADFDAVCMLAGVNADLMLDRYRAARARMGTAPRKRSKSIPQNERIAA